MSALLHHTVYCVHCLSAYTAYTTYNTHTVYTVLEQNGYLAYTYDIAIRFLGFEVKRGAGFDWIVDYEHFDYVL